MVIGITMDPVRQNSLLEMFVVKLGYAVEDFNSDAVLLLNRITVPPGLNEKLPDNLLSDAPPICGDEYAVADG